MCHDGPEFTSPAFPALAQRRGTRPGFVHPGRPVENACVESFAGRLRHEHLNER